MEDKKNIIESSPLSSPDMTKEGKGDGVITSIESPRRIGLFIFLLVFGVFGGWATFAPLDSAAVAPGSVMVESYSQVVQHLEGGIIKEIMARNGDSVSAGQSILIMDGTQDQAQLGMANSQYVAWKAQESRLIAERDGLDAVSYPNELLSNEADARAEIDAQNQIFAARKVALDGSVEVLEQRTEQLQAKRVGLEALRESKQVLVASYADELSDVTELLEQGFSDKLKLRELERNHANLQGQVAELSASISSTDVEIGEARLQILQEERNFQNEVVNRLSEIQTGLKDVSERIFALQDVVSRKIVRAPVEGILNGMQFHTVGGVIVPGEPIAQVVPQEAELIVESQVSVMDIDRVSVGQAATIRFSAFGNTVPTIFGTLISISADRLVDEITGMPYYLARIRVSPDGMDDLGDLVLLPGMPADSFITTGSRTFLQYLFKPFTNALANSLKED